MSTTGDTEYSGEDEAPQVLRGHLIEPTLVLVPYTKVKPLTGPNIQLEVVVSGGDAVEVTRPATGTCEEVHVAKSPQGMSVHAVFRLTEPMSGTLSDGRSLVGMFPGTILDTEQAAPGQIHRIVAAQDRGPRHR